MGLPEDSSDGSEAIFNANMDPAGKFKDRGIIEEDVDSRLKNITGLWMCETNLGWTKRAKAGADICFYNGTSSFKYVCPIGSQRDGISYGLGIA